MPSINRRDIPLLMSVVTMGFGLGFMAVASTCDDVKRPPETALGTLAAQESKTYYYHAAKGESFRLSVYGYEHDADVDCEVRQGGALIAIDNSPLNACDFTFTTISDMQVVVKVVNNGTATDTRYSYAIE